MARCDVCGNDYDKSFKVVQGQHEMTFDSFECAVHAMAPRIEANGKLYCCAHCARHEGVKGVADRV